MSDFESSADAVSTFATPAREGLPPSFRMRAEGHYVDLLASRSSGPREKTLALRTICAPDSPEEPAPALVESIRRYGVLQPLLVQERGDEYLLIAGRQRWKAALAAGLNEVPCLVYPVSDDKAARLAAAADIAGRTSPVAAARDSALHHVAGAADRPRQENQDYILDAGRQLTQALATLTACADLLTTASSELSRAVVADLVRAEAWRASALLLSTRIVRGELPASRAPIRVRELLEKVVHGFQAERRVRRVAVDAESDLARGTCVIGSEELLVGALCASVLATLALFDSSHDARIVVSAAIDTKGEVLLTVSQPVVTPPQVWAARAFDRAWTDRPGGTTSALAIQALQRAAELHGGRAAVTAIQGTRIAITFPTGL